MIVPGTEPPNVVAEDGADLKDAGAEFTRCVVPLVRELPAPYADALLLTDIGDMSQKETAARLSLSVSGMRSRVQRPRRMLREAVPRCCDVRTDRRGGIVDVTARASSCACPCDGRR